MRDLFPGPLPTSTNRSSSEVPGKRAACCADGLRQSFTMGRRSALRTINKAIAVADAARPQGRTGCGSRVRSLLAPLNRVFLHRIVHALLSRSSSASAPLRRRAERAAKAINDLDSTATARVSRELSSRWSTALARGVDQIRSGWAQLRTASDDRAVSLPTRFVEGLGMLVQVLDRHRSGRGRLRDQEGGDSRSSRRALKSRRVPERKVRVALALENSRH